MKKIKNELKNNKKIVKNFPRIFVPLSGSVPHGAWHLGRRASSGV